MAIQNNWLTGILAGSVTPAIAWLLFDYKYRDVQILHKPAIPYLIALAVNLFIMRYCFKHHAEQTGKGIMVVTFACMLFTFVFKVKLA